MVNPIKITVKDGKLVIPGSQLGLEDGQELVVQKTDSGLAVIDPTLVLEELSKGLEESGASVEDAIAQTQEALIAELEYLAKQ